MSCLTIFILCLFSFQYAASQSTVAVIGDASSGLVLDSPSRGTVIATQRYSSSYSRYWEIIDNEDNTFYARNIRRGTNLSVENCTEGARVTIAQGNNGGFQLWTYDEASESFSPSCNTNLTLFAQTNINIILGNKFNNATRTPFELMYTF